MRVPGAFQTLKRLVVGRAFASDRLESTRLPKRIALPTFASDALSSVAYAPDEILLTLALAGVATYSLSPWIAVAVVAVMAVVVLTNRKNVEAYPSGGGDYEVVHTNLGGGAGRVVASALLVDYVLTVAVSISQAAQYASGALPVLHGYEMILTIALIALLTVINLRGIKESGRVLAVPVYLYMGSIGLMLAWGGVKALTGSLETAPSANFEIVPATQFEQGLTALGGAFLVLRAFSSGCAALTGVEAIGNGVPSFRPPKSKNAATTLLLLGGISSVMILGIIALARVTEVHFVEDPHAQLRLHGEAIPAGYRQIPVIGQVAQAVFHASSPLFYLISFVTGLVLFLAANTAFNGFPNLASVLAKEGYLPRQLRSRGDRLAYSNGILALSATAILLVWVTGAEVTLLIQMYIVGVFVSFTFSQFGMIRHWTRLLAIEADARKRRHFRRNRVTNAIGFAMVTTVLVIVLITKFTHGAWVAVTAMALLWVAMSMISKHYAGVREELRVDQDPEDSEDSGAVAEPGSVSVHPSRSHGIVLVSVLNKPALLAMGVAGANRHTTFEAVTVQVDDSDTAELVDQWRSQDVQVPLRILYSPYRDYVGPILNYIRTVNRRSPRDVVVVYIPEFMVGHWWESILHNHSARRLKARLQILPHVVVASVPWQLTSLRRAIQQAEADGDIPRLAAR
ncbi:APC family permease [Devriesea agamarum]|uniref:APC family permease n=1 Tax=Devriesea agamarum TaxID=472569 RepID=UPI00071D1D56|nr:APC family permease [Devriesea agamarum]